MGGDMQHVLFPTVVHETFVDQFKTYQDDLVKFVLEEKKKDPAGVKKTNFGGWQSEWKEPTEDIFTRIIVETISTYFSENSIYKDMSIKLSGWWININPPGALNNMHHHAGSDLAGVFWIKTSKDCGNINFAHPQHINENRSLMMHTPEFVKRTGSYESWWVQPTEGSFLIFPAHLYHWVDPNESDENRISVSFNLNLN